jgi:hypothetical protein
MQSSSNSPAYMTLFGRVVTPYKVTLLPAGPRVRSYGRQQNIGYTLITSFHLNSRSCDTSLFLVAIYFFLKGLTLSKLTMLQYLIRTRSLSLRTRLLHLFILTMKTSNSIWAASRRQKVHRQFVSAGTEIPILPKSSLSVRPTARIGLAKSRSRHASRSRKRK